MANPSGDSSLQLSQLPHLDSLAREGCNGLLAATLGENNLSLARQILQGSTGDSSPLPRRFKNIQIALIGNSSSIETIGESAGCHTVQSLPLITPQEWPQPETLAKKLTNSLGKHFR
jgi:hypothetical protein